MQRGGFHCQTLVPPSSWAWAAIATPSPFQSISPCSLPNHANLLLREYFTQKCFPTLQFGSGTFPDPWAFPIPGLTTRYHDCLVAGTYQYPAQGLRFKNY